MAWRLRETLGARGMTISTRDDLRRLAPHPSSKTVALVAAWLVAAIITHGGASEARQVRNEATEFRPPAAETQNDRFRETMDRVFGPGRWRETSGYRSPAEEDRLRREGAGAVPEGRLSAHSLGTPDAPGAYDAVVYGMSQARAADVLRESGAGFARVFAEGTHGPEGPHLHIEPRFLGFETASVPIARVRTVAARAVACDSIYLRVVNMRINPQLAACSRITGD
jgi:hypothetical protein